ncbi:MAG TPA: GtrA family protein [Xanthobacteraceae bacterium]
MIPVDRLQSLWDRVFAMLGGRILVGQAARFAMIGVVNTSVDFGVFLFALAFLTSSLVAANVLSWTVAVTGSYVMNSFITFAAESGRRLRFRAYAGFIGSGLAGLIANTATLLIAAKLLLLPVVLAKLLAIGVSFLVNFSLARFVVFRPRPSPAE